MKSKSLISTLLLSFALLGSLLSSPAFAWWDKDWSYRTPIKLDTSSSGAQTGQALDQVPLLVRLHTGNFSFLDSKVDGSDIRFVAGDDTTPLKYQIEKFDPANNLAFIWVMLPKLEANAKTQSLQMYYGNDNASAGDAQGMYDVNQLVVLHFRDKDSFKDATAYANPVTAKGVTVKGGAEIASGAVFNGQSSLSIAATPANAFAAGGGFTFSAWVNSAASQNAVLFARQAGGIEIGLDAAGIYARVGDGKNGERGSKRRWRRAAGTTWRSPLPTSWWCIWTASRSPRCRSTYACAERRNGDRRSGRRQSCVQG